MSRRFFDYSSGATRMVFLVGGCAIKIPRLNNFRMFLQGVLANLTENEFSELDHPLLAPVILCFPFGSILIMERAQMYAAGSVSAQHILDTWFKKAKACEDVCLTELVEYKHTSIGTIRGEVVAVDYG